MKKILIILLFISPCLADGPKYGHKDARLNDEFDNAYKDIRNAAPKIGYFTKVQLQGLTPKRAGLLFYCTDCTTDGVVVSTGVAIGGIGRISARTTAIN